MEESTTTTTQDHLNNNNHVKRLAKRRAPSESSEDEDENLQVTIDDHPHHHHISNKHNLTNAINQQNLQAPSTDGSDDSSSEIMCSSSPQPVSKKFKSSDYVETSKSFSNNYNINNKRNISNFSIDSILSAFRPTEDHHHQIHHHQQHQQQQHQLISQPPTPSPPTQLQPQAQLHFQPSQSISSASASSSSQAPQPTVPSSVQQGTGSGSAGGGKLQFECQLDNIELWQKFHSLNTEMIITKTGRRMFPVVKVQFSNLNPNARYSVAMDIVPVDNKRYRYAYHKSCWQVAGKADPPSAETRLYMHPDSPFTGDVLSKQVISFEKVKLTNNEMDKFGHIILNSMHKYQPRVYLIQLKSQPSSSTSATTSPISGPSSTTAAGGPTTSHSHLNHHHNHHHHNHHQQQQQQQPQFQTDIEAYRTFLFPETVFTAVTAYQNQLITKMKIDKNPFAKGFRDSSRLSEIDAFSDGSGALSAACSSALAPCSSAQATQIQIWLAALSACFSGSPGLGQHPPQP